VYIIPAKKCQGMWSISLHPRYEKSKYGEYKEAGHLLRGESPGRLDRIEACAEEWVPMMASNSLRAFPAAIGSAY
jgi:hypothetical protein